MQALTRDDLLPLEEFADRRREFFDAHRRYLDRYRRVGLGPRLILLFENRQTLWFRLQDILRIARLREPGPVQRELDLYNRLLPARGRLQAALLPAGPEPDHSPEEWQDLRGTALRLHLGPHDYPSNLLTCRPEDRCFGAAHWVQFVLDSQGRACLKDFRQPAYFSLDLPRYRHASALLTEDVRQSLLDDLSLSERDG